MKLLTAALAVSVLVLSACSASTGAVPTTETLPTASPEPAATPTSAPAEAPAVVEPASYKKLSARNWKKLVKSPDKYVGNGYVIWACITQFDAATGDESFRADAAPKKLEYWYADGQNAFFSGSASRFADFVQDDVVQMKVISLGSYSYDTQAGGNTTVPLFQVTKITHKGSCE